MTRQQTLNIVAGIAGSLVVVLVIAWLVWVPFAKEPGYVFVAAWG